MYETVTTFSEVNLRQFVFYRFKCHEKKTAFFSHSFSLMHVDLLSIGKHLDDTVRARAV